MRKEILNSKFYILNSRKKGFTLLEMLIVVGVLSILASISVFVLKPVELLREGRDSTRIQDIRGIDKAITLGRAIDSSLMDNVATSTVYLSLPDTDSDTLCNEYSLPNLESTWEYRCAASLATLQNIDGTGWIPIDFISVPGGASFSALPIDPQNTETNNLYYTFSLENSGATYSLSATMRSQKYLNQIAATDGGNATSSFETSPIAWTTGSACSGSSFTDNTQAEFDLGIYNSTQWDGTNSWVELSTPPTSGNYTSSVKDAGINSTWDSIAWTPQRPTGKELPNNGQSETAYNTGNANMTGNVLLIHMNEAYGAIADTSGQGNNGTYNGALYSQTGKLNTAIGFDGVDDYIRIAENPSLNGLFSEFTVTAWVKATGGDGTWRCVVEFGNSTDTNAHFYYSTQQKIMANFKNEIGQNQSLEGGTTLVLNTWYFFAWTYDSVNGRVYLNGVLDGETNVTGRLDTRSGTYIGIRTGTVLPFNGAIDEVAIYNRALGPTEIADIYKRGALRLKYQVRSCDDAACSGEIFIGPSGTGSDYYEWGTTNSVSTPSFNLTNVIDNQYFQYKTYFESDNSSYSPELKSTTNNYTCL